MIITMTFLKKKLTFLVKYIMSVDFAPRKSEDSGIQEANSHRKWHQQRQKPWRWLKHHTDCRADGKDSCKGGEHFFVMFYRCTTLRGLGTHCDARPCCSPSSSPLGKPGMCRWRASRRRAAPRWGGTGWCWPGWRCSSCGPPWTRTWPCWGKCCPLADCPADTHSRGRAPRKWQETHSPLGHFAPGKLDKKTSEDLEEGKKACTLSSLKETERKHIVKKKRQTLF